MSALFPVLLVVLSGCGSSPHALVDLSGSWQIQTSFTGNTFQGILLLGSLEGSGGHVTGTFKYVDYAHPGEACLVTGAVILSGELDAKRNLTLTSGTLSDGSVISMQLVLPAVLTSQLTGTIGSTGGPCAVTSAPAAGNRFDPQNGTYTGTITPTAGTAGAISLVLQEATSPRADGSYPISATLSYSLGSCAGSSLLSGDTAGSTLALRTSSPTTTAPAPIELSVYGIAKPDASGIQNGIFNFSPPPCSGSASGLLSYADTLTRQ